MANLLTNDDYNPNRLLDTLIERFGLKTDAALSRKLEVQAPLISKIRNRHLAVSAYLLLRMHEESGLSIRELCDLMGGRRYAVFKFDPQRQRPHRHLRTDALGHERGLSAPGID